MVGGAIDEASTLGAETALTEGDPPGWSWDWRRDGILAWRPLLVQDLGVDQFCGAIHGSGALRRRDLGSVTVLQGWRCDL